MRDGHDDETASSAARLGAVSFAYRDRPVLTGLDLTVQSVGVTALLGVNGAGKSTVLNLLATVTRPDRGTVEILGRDTGSVSALGRIRSSLGYLPQEADWTGSLQVAEFVEYFAWLRRMPRRTRTAAVELALERTDTARLAGRRLSALSGGERQRAMLASAIVHEPAFLVLDEPTVGLDPEQRHHFRRVLAELGESRCVLLSTHLLEDVADIAATVLVLHAGRIAFHGSPAELGERSWDDVGGTRAIEQGFLRTINEGMSTPC